MFEMQREIPVPAASARRYTGMAHDGVSYYFVNGRDCKAYQYSEAFIQERCIDTCRNYAGICFDSENGCFWAAAADSQPVLYRLDAALREIDCLPIAVSGCDDGLGPVTNVSCDGGRLLVAFGNRLVRVDPRMREQPVVLVQTEDAWLRCALAVRTYIVCCFMSGEGQTLRVFSHEGQPVGESKLPREDDALLTALLVPSPHGGGAGRLLALVSRRCRYSYVWDCLLSDETENAPPACPDASCPPDPSRPAVTRRDSRPVPCRDANDCEDFGSSDILAAATYAERAVSRILNAQGDRLKKTLDAAGEPSEILEANRSVQMTIACVTHFEHALYDLLSALETSSPGLPNGPFVSAQP